MFKDIDVTPEMREQIKRQTLEGIAALLTERIHEHGAAFGYFVIQPGDFTPQIRFDGVDGTGATVHEGKNEAWGEVIRAANSAGMSFTQRQALKAMMLVKPDMEKTINEAIDEGGLEANEALENAFDTDGRFVLVAMLGKNPDIEPVEFHKFTADQDGKPLQPVEKIDFI